MSQNEQNSELLELTTTIVAAHVANNTVATADLPRLINTVHQALTDLGQETPPTRKPAVSIRRSVTPDYIICLDDGKKFKMLRRHLKTTYNLTPEEYRERWGLAADYPMVAPNYARQRSVLAKKIGLGRKAGGKRKTHRKRRN